MKSFPTLVPAPDIVKRPLLESIISSLSRLEHQSSRLIAKIIDFQGDFSTQVTENILHNCYDEKRSWIDQCVPMRLLYGMTNSENCQFKSTIHKTDWMTTMSRKLRETGVIP